MLAQVKSKTSNNMHEKTLNEMIRYIAKTPNHSLKHHPLDKNSLRVVSFADSSLANNPDLSTQLGYIKFLTFHTGKVSRILHAG